MFKPIGCLRLGVSSGAGKGSNRPGHSAAEERKRNVMIAINLVLILCVAGGLYIRLKGGGAENGSAVAQPAATSGPAMPAPAMPAPVTVTAPAPFDPASLAGNPAAWPKTLRLKQVTTFPAVFNSQVVGSVTVPAGTVVKLVNVQGDQLVLNYQGGMQAVAWKQTDRGGGREERTSAADCGRCARRLPWRRLPSAGPGCRDPVHRRLLLLPRRWKTRHPGPRGPNRRRSRPRRFRQRLLHPRPLHMRRLHPRPSRRRVPAPTPADWMWKPSDLDAPSESQSAKAPPRKVVVVATPMPRKKHIISSDANDGTAATDGVGLVSGTGNWMWQASPLDAPKAAATPAADGVTGDPPP